jgi:hypothetical protein
LDSSGWCVAYHGTYEKELGQILKDGYLKASTGGCYGPGVYISPSVDYAWDYSGQFEGHDIILFVRVRPGSFTIHNNEKEWLVKDTRDVRLVGILFK